MLSFISTSFSFLCYLVSREASWKTSYEGWQSYYNIMYYIIIYIMQYNVWLFVTQRTVACQAPQFMGFSRQEYWSGLLFPSPGVLPNPRIKPRSPALQADFLLSHLCEPSRKPNIMYTNNYQWHKFYIHIFYLSWIYTNLL